MPILPPHLTNTAVEADDIDLEKKPNQCDRMRMANVIEQTKAEPLSGLWLSSMGTKMQ